MSWAVCEPNRGVLRRENTRKAAVDWLCGHYCEGALEYHDSEGPGAYIYIVTDSAGEELGRWYVLRVARLADFQFDSNQSPLFPGTTARAEILGRAATGALNDLVEAHEDLVRLTDQLASARDRRRDAARRLVDLGHGQHWIAAHLGVTPQAVESFLKYRERRKQARVTAARTNKRRR